MMCIIKGIQLRILPVYCKCVLGQIIRTNTEEIYFFRQFLTDHDCCRSLDHNTLHHITICNLLTVKFLLDLFHNLLDAMNLTYRCDHRVHYSDIAIYAGTKDCTKLCLEYLRL